MAGGMKLKYRPVVEETPQSHTPIHGRGASWSPANRFEKLYIDLNDVDAPLATSVGVVDVDLDALDAELPAHRYGAPREQPRREAQYFREARKRSSRGITVRMLVSKRA